jgi:hypothetical protein
MKKTKLSKLKKGDFFQKIGGRKVYIYQGKERSYDRWGTFKGWGFYWQHYDDINEFGHTRNDIDVILL